ncbi:hypothetical protein T10_5519 [Trichinella papuae]|uniref:Uncharacterized protein n=1 Tax=Trichinella papuae TaxID=268474 RepID=A0A0V1M2N3_9BILA|nr:hypothetical protein T10_5519 [Trichinella papuae]
MFAPEGAQAGFTADFKSLELNAFGGLYTKYLKNNYSETVVQWAYQSTLALPSSLHVATCAIQRSISY